MRVHGWWRLASQEDRHAYEKKGDGNEDGHESLRERFPAMGETVMKEEGTEGKHGREHAKNAGPGAQMLCTDRLSKQEEQRHEEESVQHANDGHGHGKPSEVFRGHGRTEEKQG